MSPRTALLAAAWGLGLLCPADAAAYDLDQEGVGTLEQQNACSNSPTVQACQSVVAGMATQYPQSYGCLKGVDAATLTASVVDYLKNNPGSNVWVAMDKEKAKRC
jgi:hypothetical protein